MAKSIPPAKIPVPLAKKLRQASEYIKNGKSTQVLDGLNALAKSHPNIPLIFDLLCSANADLGRHNEAIQTGKRAVELNPTHADSRIRYAMALQNAGEFDESLLEFERALYYAPNHPQALRSKLSVYTDIADHDNAMKALDTLLKAVENQKLEPHEICGIALSKARLSPKPLPPEPVIEELIPLAESETLPAGFRVLAYHHLGRLYENLKDYDRAMEYWTKGNNLNKPKWDPDAHSRYISKLIHCWKDIAKVPVAPVDGSRLIFIIGMMRSGTSMTEQMIAQLPNVTPGGEMNAISRPVFTFEPEKNPSGARPFPTTRLVYNQRVINEMSRTAAQFYNKVAETGFVTDKQPHNIFYAPLITRMFPGAKIIHCCRDAQDCCLSNFQQSFARSHPHTHDLYWLGRYHADYQRMMDAWHQLPEMDILDVQYEEMVADPETQSKRVCEFLNMPWTEDILNFHTSDRTVRTASRDQVRKPIYQSSVKKYTRYDAHLAPLRQGLGLEPTPPTPPSSDA